MTLGDFKEATHRYSDDTEINIFLNGKTTLTTGPFVIMGDRGQIMLTSEDNLYSIDLESIYYKLSTAADYVADIISDVSYAIESHEA